MVGELSQYRQVKVTPDNSGYLTVSNPLSIEPKIIIISCAADSDAATGTNKLIEGIVKLFGGIAAGGIGYYNTSMTYVTSSYKCEDNSTSNAIVGIYDGNIRINRYTAAILWSTETEYTLDIYG